VKFALLAFVNSQPAHVWFFGCQLPAHHDILTVSTSGMLRRIDFTATQAT
jgi:hypothetical protein